MSRDKNQRANHAHLLSSGHDVKVIWLFNFFFKMTYWSHNIFKNNYSTGIVSTFTDTL